jgi:hypothetical protein
MKTLEILKTRKEEIIEATLEVMPRTFKGDRANRAFFFKVDKETNKLTVDYIYYVGNQYFSDNYFYTIPNHETPDPEDYGYDSVEEMDFDFCGYREFIEYSINSKIANLEACESNN